MPGPPGVVASVLCTVDPVWLDDAGENSVGVVKLLGLGADGGGGGGGGGGNSASNRRWQASMVGSLDGGAEGGAPPVQTKDGRGDWGGEEISKGKGALTACTGMGTGSWSACGMGWPSSYAVGTPRGWGYHVHGSGESSLGLGGMGKFMCPPWTCGRMECWKGGSPNGGRWCATAGGGGGGGRKRPGAGHVYEPGGGGKGGMPPMGTGKGTKGLGWGRPNSSTTMDGLLLRLRLRL